MQIRGWLKSHADEAVRGTIGDNFMAAQALQEQHDKFEMKTQVCLCTVCAYLLAHPHSKAIDLSD